jgi:hypothetical protein
MVNNSTDINKTNNHLSPSHPCLVKTTTTILNLSFCQEFGVHGASQGWVSPSVEYQRGKYRYRSEWFFIVNQRKEGLKSSSSYTDKSIANFVQVKHNMINKVCTPHFINHMIDKMADVVHISLYFSNNWKFIEIKLPDRFIFMWLTCISIMK